MSKSKIITFFCSQRMKLFYFVLALLFSSVLQAQQEWSSTQYLFNLYDVNTAYAGNQLSSSFALRYRSQWLGMEGAPVTQQFSFHTPLMQERIGVGIKVLNESIGARTQQFAKASAAYKLWIGENTLSVGIAAGMQRQAVEWTKLTAVDIQDAQLANISTPIVTPLVDASVFYNSKKFYAGIESRSLNRSAFRADPGSLARLYYNVNFTAGIMKRVMSDNMIQLTTLIKYSEGKIIQGELNLLYLINNRIWFGVGYRYNSGVQAMGSFNITRHFRIGLSYDFPVSQLRNANDGSAEVFIGYNLKNRSGKSIRYF